MLDRSLRGSNRPVFPKRLLLTICLVLATEVAAAESAPLAKPAGEDVGVEIARGLVLELARLDERLELGTFPDGSGLWTARLAAALEYRLDDPDSPGAPVPDLMRRLAFQLRAHGVERDVAGPPPELSGRTGRRNRPGPQRTERVQRILETTLLLHDKLDRLEAPAPAGGSVSTSLTPANDDCAAASVIMEGTITGSTTEATNDGSSSCAATTSPDVWYRYTSPQAGHVRFDTFDSAFDTVLSVHTGCPANGRHIELACNDDTDGTLQSETTVELAEDQEVWVRVGGGDGSSGSFDLTVGRPQGIEGTITREGTGNPIAGASVTVYLDGWGYLEHEAITGADGSYALGDLVEGTYYVRAEAEGAVGEIYTDVSCPFFSDCVPTAGATPVEVTSGLAPEIDLALEPAATISGAVTDFSSGDAVEVFVDLYSDDGTFLHSVATGPDGTYEIGGLPSGTYHLVTEASGHRDELYDDLPCPGGCDVTTGTPIVVSSGADLTGVDFVLNRLATIEGTVTEAATGDPVSGTQIAVHDSSGTEVARVYNESDGTYRVAGLEPGTYFVRTHVRTIFYPDHENQLYDQIPCRLGCDVTTGTPVTVDLDTRATGIDFVLLRLAVITGTVTHTVSGAPLSGVHVTAYPVSGSTTRGAITTSDGSYRIERLPTGSYTVVARSDLHRDEVYDDLPCTGECDPVVGASVSATAGTTTTAIDFALDRLGIIEGRVTEAGSGEGIDLKVVAYDPSGAFLASTRASYFGDYSLPGVPEGTAYVKTFNRDGLSGAFEDELFDDLPCDPTCDVSQGMPIPIELNTSVVGVDFVLAPCPAESFEEVTATRYISAYTEEACEHITAGDGTTVGSGADVTFRSGGSIVLTDGFQVESGATFRGVIEPSWTDE